MRLRSLSKHKIKPKNSKDPLSRCWFAVFLQGKSLGREVVALSMPTAAHADATAHRLGVWFPNGRSEYFDAHLHMHYLLRMEQSGVQDYLVPWLSVSLGGTSFALSLAGSRRQAAQML